MRLVSAYYEDSGPFLASGMFNGVFSSSDPDSLCPDDCLVVWGGEDISPSLYNHENTGHTWAGTHPSRRDYIEWSMMKRAKELALPIIGVCRGAQMLCALAGGYLIQHVNNHDGTHLVHTIDGQTFKTNSIHHQMQFPFNVEHKLLAWTEPRSSEHWAMRDGPRSITPEIECEPELVYYPGVKGLAVQWHPEMMAVDAPATQYIFNFMRSVW